MTLNYKYDSYLVKFVARVTIVALSPCDYIFLIFLSVPSMWSSAEKRQWIYVIASFIKYFHVPIFIFTNSFEKMLPGIKINMNLNRFICNIATDFVKKMYDTNRLYWFYAGTVEHFSMSSRYTVSGNCISDFGAESGTNSNIQ